MTDKHNNQSKYSQAFFQGCLLHGGWQPVSLEKDLYLILHQGKTGPFPIYGKFVPEKYVVSFSGVYPYPVPNEKLPVVLAYINYTNYGVPFGNLELRELTNEVCFRTGLMFFNIELTGQLVNNLIHNCAEAMDRYMPGVNMIVERNLNVQQAHKATMPKS